MGQFFHRLRRRPGENINRFCIRFNRAYSELDHAGVKLPAEAVRHFLFRSSGLSYDQQTQVIATCYDSGDIHMVQ